MGRRPRPRRHAKPEALALFGTTGAVEPGKIYGEIAQGTARVLYTPAITHPAEHISHEAIGYSLDWFAKTLQGGTPQPADDQIWFRKEFGTLVALLGFVVLLIGAFDGLLEANVFAAPAARDRRRHHAGACRGRRPPLDHGVHPVRVHPGADLLSGAGAGRHLCQPSAFLPQGITNQIMVWALINALITLALMRSRRSAPAAPDRRPSILIAVATVAIGYAALWLADLVFKIDFRFWIVALKLMSAKQCLIFLIYLVPFTAFFVVALHVLHRNFSTMGTGRAARSISPTSLR